MNQPNLSLLQQIIRQFMAKHRRPPSAVILSPEALAALAAKGAAADRVGTIPVLCRQITPEEVAAQSDDANAVGVVVAVQPDFSEASVVGCSLKV